MAVDKTVAVTAAREAVETLRSQLAYETSLADEFEARAAAHRTAATDILSRIEALGGLADEVEAAEAIKG